MLEDLVLQVSKIIPLLHNINFSLEVRCEVIHIFNQKGVDVAHLIGKPFTQFKNTLILKPNVIYRIFSSAEKYIHYNFKAELNRSNTFNDYQAIKKAKEKITPIIRIKNPGKLQDIELLESFVNILGINNQNIYYEHIRIH